MRWLLAPVLLSLALTGATIMPAAAQESAAEAAAHETVRNNLVHLSATGVATTGPNATLPDSARAQGTGFFVSDDGFILTTRHFFAPLEKVGAENVQITARIGDAAAEPALQVAFVSELPRLDMALLRARFPHGVPRPGGLALGDSTAIDPAAPPVLLTSGFHDRHYRKRSAALNDLLSVDVPYAMTLNVKMNPGESGSPVYVRGPQGVRVVAMLKGSSSTDDELTLAIPVEYAMPLIGHFQMRMLQQRVSWLMRALGEIAETDPPLQLRLTEVEKNVSEIGSYFNWIVETPVDGSLRIRYEKIVGGGPQVDEIEVNVVPNIRLLTGENGLVATGPAPRLRLTEQRPTVLQRASLDEAQRTGEFVLHGVQEKLEMVVATREDAVGGTEPFRDLEVTIVPKIDGDALEARRINVVPDYQWE